jgi:hypothetical protein
MGLYMNENAGKYGNIKHNGIVRDDTGRSAATSKTADQVRATNDDEFVTLHADP